MTEQTRNFKLRKVFWIFSLVIFAISLVCPTYCTSIGCNGIGSGVGDLLFGWLGAILDGGAYMAWFANPFFLIAILSNKKIPGLSLVMSIFATLIGLSFLRGGEVLIDEAGHKAYITGFQIGYWLWLFSMIFMLVASILSMILPNNRIEHHIDERKMI